MKDTDIIKALEHCIKCYEWKIASCNGCVLEKYFPDCDNAIEAMCLDLIKRQQAEIERLHCCVKSEDEVRNIMKEQMIPMVREITADQIEKAHELGKLEGYVELAERLREDIVEDENNPLSNRYPILTNAYLDRIVKEMTEGV